MEREVRRYDPRRDAVVRDPQRRADARLSDPSLLVRIDQLLDLLPRAVRESPPQPVPFRGLSRQVGPDLLEGETRLLAERREVEVDAPECCYAAIRYGSHAAGVRGAAIRMKTV